MNGDFNWSFFPPSLVPGKGAFLLAERALVFQGDPEKAPQLTAQRGARQRRLATVWMLWADISSLARFLPGSQDGIRLVKWLLKRRYPGAVRITPLISKMIFSRSPFWWRLLDPVFCSCALGFFTSWKIPTAPQTSLLL